MFITKTKAGCRSCKKQMVNDIGLGDNPITGIIGGAGGFATNIVSKVPIVGPVVGKIFGGLFKKATHMGDCMKWWNNENNIRGMVSWITPYPVNVESIFPEESQEYRLQHMSSITGDSGIQSLLSISNRVYTIGTYYIQGVRANPDIMQMSCMTQPNVQRETGQVVSPSEVEPYFAQLREQAQQQEYQETVQAIGKMLSSYKAVVERKAAVIQKTREVAASFKLPEGVTSISKGGALMIAPGANTNLIINRGILGKPTETKASSDRLKALARL